MMEHDRDPLRKIQTKHAPEVQADIGTALKAARTKKGHTIEAVSQHTRIPKKFLDALEGNRFDEFPALAYLRGFLKTYCDYLEVDFDALWIQIVPKAPAEPAAQSQPAPSKAPAAKAAGPAQPRPTTTDDGHAPHAAPRPAARADKKPAHPQPHGPAQPSKAVAGVLVALGGLGLIVGLFLMNARKPAVRVHEVSLPPAALQPIKAPTAAQVVIVYRSDTWVSIAADGAAQFEGRVPQGAKQQWSAKKELALRASDPEALKITINGAPVALPAPQADGTFRVEVP
jgi:cytoskeletal protein RodZ